MPYAPPPALLAAAARLALTAPPLRQALGAGRHRSLRRGAAVEFSEHRGYQPGDDLRRLDWRALAKADRLLVRQGEDEARLTVELVLDTSASMQFDDRFAAARDLAAAAAYLALRQGDRVALVAASDRQVLATPPRAGMAQMAGICAALGGLAPAGATAPKRALAPLAAVPRPGATTLVLSDLCAPVEDTVAALALLAAGRRQVAVLHLVAAAERDFPYGGIVAFAGMEGEGVRVLDADAARPPFVAAMAARQATLTRLLGRLGVTYRHAFGDEPAVTQLARVLGLPPAQAAAVGQKVNPP